MISRRLPVFYYLGIQSFKLQKLTSVSHIRNGIDVHICTSHYSILPLYLNFKKFITTNIKLITYSKCNMSQSNLPSKDQLKETLSPLEYHVTQEKGTERPFTGKYDKFYEPGMYVCIVCNQNLFSSNTKYDSGCGWPAFNEVLDKGLVKLSKDTSGGRIRTEVQCSRCDAHLGHVFDDGPLPTRKRFCINSASLQFIPSNKQLEK